MSPEERQRHIDLVRGLSMSGGVLEKDAPTATINNREWFRSNGSPRPERRALHDQLYAEVRAQFPEARQDARALVLAGPPGAGKGSVAEKVLGADISQFVNVDADEFKKLLLREAIADGSYESAIKPVEVRDMEATGETFYPLELASLVHTESSRLAAALREDLIAEKTNVVVDTVLGDERSADGLADQLTRAGYEVTVIDVEVPYLVSEDRIKMRWQEAMAEAEAGKAGALGGRGRQARTRAPCSTPSTAVRSHRTLRRGWPRCARTCGATNAISPAWTSTNRRFARAGERNR